MNYQQALNIINGPSGYLVCFRRIQFHPLGPNHTSIMRLGPVECFPDISIGDKLISSIDEASALMKAFANKTKDVYCNFYIADNSGEAVKGNRLYPLIVNYDTSQWIPKSSSGPLIFIRNDKRVRTLSISL